MINVTTRQLEVFVEIAQTGNLTKASEKLHMTQSACSMSLKELEKVMGSPLFNRIGRGLALNERGREVLPRAEKIVKEMLEIVECDADDNDLSGVVYLGASTTIAAYDLPHRIKTIKEEYPHITITLKVGNTEDIIKGMRSGELDFGLIEGEIEGDDLVCENWLKDELIVIASPDHRLAQRKRIQLKALAKEDWIVREHGSGTLSTLSQVLKTQNIELANILEIGHTEAIKRSVEAGMGIACLSRIAVQREVESEYLVELKSTVKINRWFQLVTFKNRYQSRVTKKVIELLK